MRTIARLTALKVAKTEKPGLYPDGAGLYLLVSPGGTKSWIFRYMLAGRAREMGLGPLHTVSLAEARLHALECRKQKLDGIDPIDARKQARAELMEKSVSAKTFKQCADSYISAHKDGWKNEKHAHQWVRTLEAYAWPKIRDKAIQSITTSDVIDILEPIWKSKTETASRLRGRIESVLDWATARGYRKGENPARWRGHLENLLPKRSRVKKVKHFAALPYVRMADFFAELDAQKGVSSWALEFLILTASRTSEVVAARWDEVDFQSKIWIIPGERMKAGREHRVPLSLTAIDILKRVRKAQKTGGLKESQYIFVGDRPNSHLSNMALLKLLQRMGQTDLTVHGFRSTFRDWAAEKTHHAREVAEMALAHTVGDKVEAAYRRGDLFEKRRAIMDDWADYCLGGTISHESRKAEIKG